MKKFVSYSELSLWEKDREEYVRRYVKGIEQEPSREMKIGSLIHKTLTLFDKTAPIEFDWESEAKELGIKGQRLPPFRRALGIVPMALEKGWAWILWSVLWVPIIATAFTGFPLTNNHGDYKGYVTAVEQQGAIFKGWSVYLKTELESSNEDVACIDRNNQKLIDDLRQAMKEKKNVNLRYEGAVQYPIGVCPSADWMVKEII